MKLAYCGNEERPGDGERNRERNRKRNREKNRERDGGKEEGKKGEGERERESSTTHLGAPFCDTAWPGQARNGEGHRLAALGLNC